MQTVSNINPNQTLRHSKNHEITSSENTEREITREEEIALFAVINQTRALQGWTLSTASELEPIAKVWWRELSRHKIPHQHYNRLYQRALDARVRAINLGVKNIPNIDAIAMIAEWPELRRQIREREIASGRLLPTMAASDCEKCYGSGMEIVQGNGARRCECRA